MDLPKAVLIAKGKDLQENINVNCVEIKDFYGNWWKKLS